MFDTQELRAQLEHKYVPPLDSATFLAILSDYDLSNPNELRTLQTVLDTVTEGAESEEATGFDPSGSSGVDTRKETFSGDLFVVNGDSSSRPLPVPQWSDSSHTDTTSISQSMSLLELDGLDFTGGSGSVPEALPERRTTITQGTSLVDLEGLDFASGTGTGSAAGSTPTERSSSPPETAYDLQLENLDEAGKKKVLNETFPNLKAIDIDWALKKSKDMQGAIEELLNQVFLEESGERRRGIDGFLYEGGSEPGPRRKKKGKKNRKFRTEDQAAGLSEAGSVSVTSKWDAALEDINFITSKTGMSQQQVSSMYHSHGATVASTLKAILEAYPVPGLEDMDTSQIQHVINLGQEFPTIPPAHIQALVDMTWPFKSTSHELAQALTTRPAASTTRPSIQIEIKPPPLNLDEPSSPSSARPYAHNAVHHFEAPSLLSPSFSTNSAARATSYTNARNTAFTQASVAYKKGKSDPLMGGAAAYYSSVGRDYDARAKSFKSAAADELVRGQSGPGWLDLHGVEVKDAVRIARERVTAWWAQTRVDRIDGRHGGSYKIVTGVGRHSEGGVAKLGPAVGRMLIRERWKVECGSGVVVVTGVAGKKK